MAAAAQQQRVSFVGTKISAGITEFAARLSKIDRNLALAIKSGSVQVVDFALYNSVALNANTTIEAFQASDDKEVGKTNINKRQLEANTYFLVTGIQILEANLAGANGATIDIKNAEYNVILPEIANGEFELKVGDKVLVPRNSMEIFRTPASVDKRVGYYELDCPKLITPLTDIVPWIYLPKATTNKALKIVFYGVKTNKA